MTTEHTPPLPEPCLYALVEGVAMQGSEYRSLSVGWEFDSARFSEKHLLAYARAYHAHQSEARGRALLAIREVFCASGGDACAWDLVRIGVAAIEERLKEQST